jgi:nucleotide-binding universal stress UspA family protein
MLEAILHPSDLSLGTNAAFLHALRIALEAKGELTILHSQRRSVADEADWHSFPGVRATLSRWGLIADDAPESAVESQLGVLITKAELYDPSPVGSVVRWLEGHGCDLLVMATHSREGLERWLRGSVSVDLARQTPVPSLFLPISAPGFVNPDSGKAVIRNILIPVDGTPTRAPRLCSPWSWRISAAEGMPSCTCCASVQPRRLPLLKSIPGRTGACSGIRAAVLSSMRY